MSTPTTINYLFLLANPSTESCRIARKEARELNIPVLSIHNNVAMEVQCNSFNAEKLYRTGLFKAMFKGSVKVEHLQQLSEPEKRVVDIWNTRFSKAYIRKKKDKTHYGKSWGGHKDLGEPLPYSKYDEEKLKTLLEAYIKEHGPKTKDKRPVKVTDKHLKEAESRFARFSKDPATYYNLKTLYARLSSHYKIMIAEINWELLKAILEALLREEVCWKMHGEIAVGIVFVESSRRGGPKFGDTERNEICDEIITGLNWLASQHPADNLSWVMDFQFIKMDVADTTDADDTGGTSGKEAHWRDPAMALVNYRGNTYTANWNSVGQYREHMRVANFSKHAYVIFVTPYNNNWYAYASGGRVTLAKHNDWEGWGQNILDTITAHETSHLFGSMDEYTGSGTPCASCEAVGGCDKIPNGNCGACAAPPTDCMMSENEHRICEYTKGHIGWSDLFVELWTADEAWAGTDDDVWIDIGDRQFVLDNISVDDRERNNRNGYAVWGNGISREEIKRILIRKSSDGTAGGWKLRRVRVFHQGQVICDQTPNKWIEDDHLWWVGCVFNESLVNKLTVKITTGDVAWAGTDDDVSIVLGGRTWNLDNPGSDDFERNATNTFELDPGTSFYVTDIHALTINKSPDGFAGGWRLKGVEVIVNNSSIFNRQNINKWLEDDDRSWSSAI